MTSYDKAVCEIILVYNMINIFQGGSLRIAPDLSMGIQGADDLRVNQRTTGTHMSTVAHAYKMWHSHGCAQILMGPWVFWRGWGGATKWMQTDMRHDNRPGCWLFRQSFWFCEKTSGISSPKGQCPYFIWSMCTLMKQQYMRLRISHVGLDRDDPMSLGIHPGRCHGSWKLVRSGVVP